MLGLFRLRGSSADTVSFRCNARDPEQEPVAGPGVGRHFVPLAPPSFPAVAPVTIAHPVPLQTADILRRRAARMRSTLGGEQLDPERSATAESDAAGSPMLVDREASAAAEPMDVDQEDPRHAGGGQNGVSPTATVPAAPIVPHAQPRPTGAANVRRWR